MNKTKMIRRLNDAFRTSFVGGKVMLTLGIRAKSDIERTEILERILNFHDFTKSNDPYGEHDMGRFDYKGEKIIWKIDYYDKQYKMMSDNPDITNRVMTIMLADEY